jgi:hypothetical protein
VIDDDKRDLIRSTECDQVNYKFLHNIVIMAKVSGMFFL